MKVTSIRFNLKFFNADGGEEVVRTLADLRSKFNLSDLYDYFKAGDLARWLRSISEQTLADDIDLIEKNDLRQSLGTLCAKLRLNVDGEAIAEFCDMTGRQEAMKDSHNKSAVAVGKEDVKERKSYIECISAMLDAKDMTTARTAVADTMRYYADRLAEDFLKQRSSECLSYFYFTFFTWCALLGCKRWSPFFQACGCHFVFESMNDQLINGRWEKIRVACVQTPYCRVVSDPRVVIECDQDFYDSISWEP